MARPEASICFGIPSRSRYFAIVIAIGRRNVLLLHNQYCDVVATKQHKGKNAGQQPRIVPEAFRLVSKVLYCTFSISKVPSKSATDCCLLV